jgi:hypothetical protein
MNFLALGYFVSVAVLSVPYRWDAPPGKTNKTLPLGFLYIAK